MAKISESIGLAECGASSPPAAAVVSGINPETGKPYINQVFSGPNMRRGQRITQMPGGRSAMWAMRACVSWIRSSWMNCGCRSMCTRGDFFPDTEGAGRTCGAPQAFRPLRPPGRLHVADLQFGWLDQRSQRCARWSGGGECRAAQDLCADGGQEDVPRVGQVFLDAGELIESRSCGGGGFGPPAERDPERVRVQVSEGFLSIRERARDVYRVSSFSG